MMLKGLTINNEIIQKAVFQLLEYDTVLTITYYNYDNQEILLEGYNIMDKEDISKLQEGLEKSGIKVQYRSCLTIDTENKRATL